MAKGIKLSLFKTDKVKETEGVWYDFGEGCKLKIARVTRPEFREYTTSNLKSLMKIIRRGRLSKEETDKIEQVTLEGYAKYILIDWKGLLNDDGEEIPYTYENALEALSIDDFNKEVSSFAEDGDNYRNDYIEESVKN